MKPVLIGLCGRSGSGKGYVSALFAAQDIPSIDTDAVYRGMTGPSDELSPCMKELTERFGDCILSDDGSLDRAVMRSLVFGDDRQALLDLDAITHRHILAETERIACELAEKGYPIVLVDAPLLYESGFDKKCARVICVTAPEEKLIRRIMRRDGITEEAARARLGTQKPVTELTDKADYILENNGDDEALLRQVQSCADELRNLLEEGTNL